MLVEEAFGTQVDTGFIYLVPVQEVVKVNVAPRPKQLARDPLGESGHESGRASCLH